MQLEQLPMPNHDTLTHTHIHCALVNQAEMISVENTSLCALGTGNRWAAALVLALTALPVLVPRRSAAVDWRSIYEPRPRSVVGGTCPSTPGSEKLVSQLGFTVSHVWRHLFS